MTTKTALRADMRGRRRQRRAQSTSLTPASRANDALSCDCDRTEAEGIACQVRALVSSMGGVSLPALFVSTPLEPDTSLTLELFDRSLLPVLLDEAGEPLPGPRWGLREAGQALVSRGRPPAQPAGVELGAQALASADLIVIPALAVSVDGARLGQGGGWYDRALTHRSPTARVVAVVFDDEILRAGSIPTEAHDIPVDAIVTPTRTIVVHAR